MVNRFRASPLILFVFFTSPSLPGQTSAPATGKPTAPGLIKLTGDDEKRAKELDLQIDQAMKADSWNKAIERAEELVALRTKLQGSKHFETMNVQWELKALRRLAPMPRGDRAAYQSGISMIKQADRLNAQGKYAAAQPLYAKALEIRRRLLTDDHPHTATSYNNLALNLNAQGKYAAAQPLCEKALEIRRRLLTDDHPHTAISYISLAYNLDAQGKYAAAQPLLEKALETTTPQRQSPRHCQQLQQPGGQPRRPGQVRGSPAAVREGAGDLPPTAHRRSPPYRPKLQQSVGQPR